MYCIYLNAVLECLSVLGADIFLFSCSHLLDTVIAVWDVRRSYIPLASFMSHSDDVTGVICVVCDMFVY